jgi:hypothetical protein
MLHFQGLEREAAFEPIIKQKYGQRSNYQLGELLVSF